MPPEEGEQAPGFEALLCDGQTFRSRRLADAAEGGAVLVFSASAFSAIAENWWTRYERAGWADLDVPVLGVSRDAPYGVNAFLRYLDSPFRMFADVDGGVSEAYDLLVAREGMANTSTPRRATFVLDADRTVRYRWVAEDWVSPAPREPVAAAVRSL
jgi:peroxiredoxin